MLAKEPFNAIERRAVAALAGLYSLRMLGLFMVLPVLGVYALDLPGATPTTLGLALGAYGLTQACLQLPLGWLSDRVGRRPIVIAGLAVFILGSLVAGNADTINGIIAGRFLQGCGAIAAALTALAADYTRDSQRTKTMAIIGASIGLSFVAALVFGPLLAAWGGLSLIFYVVAAMTTVGMAVFIVGLPAQPARETPGRMPWESANVFGGGLPILYGSIFMLHALLMMVFLVVPVRLVSEIGLEASQHWQLYLGTVVLSLPPALLLMRWGRGDADPRGPLLAAAAALVAGLLMALLATGLFAVIAAFFLMFVGINALEALLPAVVSRIAPGERRGTVMGVFSTGQFLGIFLGGTCGGLLLDVGGAEAVASTIAGASIVWCGALLLLRVAPSELAPSELAPSEIATFDE